MWVALIVSFRSLATSVRDSAGPLTNGGDPDSRLLYFCACMFKEHAIVLPGSADIGGAALW